MIDIETMGTRPDAPVIAIGAVKFDAHGAGDTMYHAVDMATVGGVPDMGTVRWWLCQSDDARAAVAAGSVHIATALDDLALWIGHDALVWGNGAGFDNVILRATYTRMGRETPWPTFSDRCYRTIKNLFPRAPKPKRRGTAHNALDDAVFQAEHLVEIDKFYRLGVFK